MAYQEEEPRWRRLSVREVGAEAAEDAALHEGVPPWLKASLGSWIERQLADRFGSWNQNQLLRLERELLISLDWAAGTDYAGSTLLRQVQSDEELCLNVVDYLLRDLRDPEDRLRWSSLALMLQEAGSAWTVDGGHRPAQGFGLVRRVAETVEASAQQAFRAPRAGDHLRSAWHGVYGRSPNPSEAYREAVRAVEAAARPIVTPKDNIATLGKMVAALRDGATKWEMVFGGSPAIDQVDVVRLIAKLLWDGQTDRHGSDDPQASVPITQEQAQAAVHLAVLLVQWFSAGSIRRAS